MGMLERKGDALKRVVPIEKAQKPWEKREMGSMGSMGSTFAVSFQKTKFDL
jgi:hypothetical protein